MELITSLNSYEDISTLFDRFMRVKSTNLEPLIQKFTELLTNLAEIR
jgi:hypothetical protein